MEAVKWTLPLLSPSILSLPTLFLPWVSEKRVLLGACPSHWALGPSPSHLLGRLWHWASSLFIVHTSVLRSLENRELSKPNFCTQQIIITLGVRGREVSKGACHQNQQHPALLHNPQVVLTLLGDERKTKVVSSLGEKNCKITHLTLGGACHYPCKDRAALAPADSKVALANIKDPKWWGWGASKYVTVGAQFEWMV